MWMCKIIKYILFSTVLAVVILHATIPHPHSNELTQETHFELHKKTHSLIGVVRLAFHERNGENLDNLIFIQYKSAKKIDIKLTNTAFPLFNRSLSIIEKRETLKSVAWNTDNFIKLFFVKLNGLRGPPQLT